MRAAFADTNAATARVLARNGFEVVVPETQNCCGALHAHAGERSDARVLARRNIASLEELDVDAFIVNAAGCGAALKEYGWLLKDDPAWSERAERFASRVKDASEFLGDAGLTAPPGAMRVRVAYDDPCHLLHGQKIREQPRALLSSIPELQMMPLTEADWCCGSAGTYNVTQPELSAQAPRAQGRPHHEQRRRAARDREPRLPDADRRGPARRARPGHRRAPHGPPRPRVSR